MEDVFVKLLEGGNTISVVTVVLVGAIAFIWAITTERLFSGPRGKEMQQTIKEQREALKEARDELRTVELDYERLRLFLDLQKGEHSWPYSDDNQPSQSLPSRTRPRLPTHHRIRKGQT